MTPVFLLTVGYIANGAEPWLLPDIETYRPITPGFRYDAEGFQPYQRDPETLSRPWAVPGTPGRRWRPCVASSPT